MLEVVDRVGRARAAPARRARAPDVPAASSASDVVVRHVARDRAHQLQRVERRHARAAAGRIDARERDVDAVGGGADGQTQPQPLARGAVVAA